MTVTFYRDRCKACPLYGFQQGEIMLQMILNSAEYDRSLTAEEFNSIIIECWNAHKKLMEVNYNEGW